MNALFSRNVSLTLLDITFCLLALLPCVVIAAMQYCLHAFSGWVFIYFQLV